MTRRCRCFFSRDLVSLNLAEQQCHARLASCLCRFPVTKRRRGRRQGGARMSRTESSIRWWLRPFVSCRRSGRLEGYAGGVGKANMRKRDRGTSRITGQRRAVGLHSRELSRVRSHGACYCVCSGEDGGAMWWGLLFGEHAGRARLYTVRQHLLWAGIQASRYAEDVVKP
jgi:hypothetical protein